MVPIEVKAQNGRSRSLDELLAEEAIPYGFKLVDGNLGVSGKKITLPHYMAMFLSPEIGASSRKGLTSLPPMA